MSMYIGSFTNLCFWYLIAAWSAFFAFSIWVSIAVMAVSHCQHFTEWRCWLSSALGFLFNPLRPGTGPLLEVRTLHYPLSFHFRGETSLELSAFIGSTCIGSISIRSMLLSLCWFWSILSFGLLSLKVGNMREDKAILLMKESWRKVGGVWNLFLCSCLRARTNSKVNSQLHLVLAWLDFNLLR